MSVCTYLYIHTYTYTYIHNHKDIYLCVYANTTTLWIARDILRIWLYHSSYVSTENKWPIIPFPLHQERVSPSPWIFTNVSRKFAYGGWFSPLRWRNEKETWRERIAHLHTYKNNGWKLSNYELYGLINRKKNKWGETQKRKKTLTCNGMIRNRQKSEISEPFLQESRGIVKIEEQKKKELMSSQVMQIGRECLRRISRHTQRERERAFLLAFRYVSYCLPKIEECLIYIYTTSFDFVLSIYHRFLFLFYFSFYTFISSSRNDT